MKRNVSETDTEEDRTSIQKRRPEPPTLEFIPNESDDLAARHAQLDAAVLQDLSKFQVTESNISQPLCASLLLHIVAEHCTRLGPLSLVGAIALFKKYGDPLRDLVAECCRNRQFEKIRNLYILQRDYNQAAKEKAVKEAWTLPYIGNTHLLLRKTINTMNRTRIARTYANCLSIFQSSGTGKSRTVHELGKLIFTIPLNLRPETEHNGFAYPLPDNAIRNFLVGAPSEPQKARLYFVRFLHGLFTTVLEEVEKLPRVNTLEEVAQAWSTHLEDGDVRNGLYEKVVEVVRKQEGVVEQQDKSATGATDSKYSRTAKDDEKQADFIGKQTGGKVQMLISRIDQLASGCRDTEKGVRIVVYFDGEHELTVTPKPGEGKLGARSLYHCLCSAAGVIVGQPVFCVFLSTRCSLSSFAPSQRMYPPARITGREGIIRHPFTELPFDCLPDGRPFIKSGTMNLDEVSTIEFMCLFGRPLFSSLLSVQNKGDSALLVKLARTKLIGEWDWARLSADAELAVLSVRLLLDFNLARENSHMTTIRLVQNHMAMAYSVPAHREVLKAGYPSEPILAEAAAQQMCAMRSKVNAESLSALLEFMDNGLIDKGERGELVARLIFILAYDKAVEMYYGTQQETQPIYSRAVPVNYFIRALFGGKNAENIFKSLPDNVVTGVTFEQAFADAWVRFTHFQCAGTSSIISTEGGWAAAARAIAFQCHPCQEAIDIFIPIVLGKESKLSESSMSGILVQVKARVKAVPEAFVQIDERNINFFPRQRSQDERPYITIVMELGAQESYQPLDKYYAPDGVTQNPKGSPSRVRTTAMRKQTGRHPTRKEHPRYAIFARGCSASVYSVVDNKEIYAALVSSRHVLREHPRQDSDSLSAVRQLKPFWAPGPECYDWTGHDALSRGFVEEATEEVYTADAVESGEDPFTAVNN
ncbi:hypothetical protein M0805_008163 [Coniferiporia weirii]|nr:hypothetical protein M0805_008163 [Coniferiporia weirii]